MPQPEQLKLLIRRTTANTDVPLPKYMSEHASGMDVFAANEGDIVLQAGEFALIPTGFAIALPEGCEAQMRPRSGLALKHGVTLMNSPGTIDADYRGEVGVILINHGKKTFTVKRGDRIAQMVVMRFSKADFEVVEELPESARDTGGFGSTGV